MTEYGVEVLGRCVLIKFTINDGPACAFFRGKVVEFKATLVQDDDDGSSSIIERDHFIVFDDNDERWFDLRVEEEMGRLLWIDDAQLLPPTAAAAAATSNTSSKTLPARKRLSSGRAAAKPTPAQRKKKETTTVAVTPERKKMKSAAAPGPHKQQPKIMTINEKWLNEMEHWLQVIPHGNRHHVVSQANAQSVMRQVKKLVAGDGITYCGWDDGVIFYNNVNVDLSFDFEQMYEEARDFEDLHGKDKGHGWLLLHPIKKLQLFKEYYYSRKH